MAPCDGGMSASSRISRTIVLALVNHYLPSYKSGGPVRSLANLVAHLGSEFDFRIITRDRDAGDQHAFESISVDTWNSVGQARVYYASPRRLEPRSFFSLISDTPHDVLYLNSFFDPVFTVQVMVGRRLGCVPRRPTVVAPRGEFSPGALQLKSRRKQLYQVAAEIFGLYDDIHWQASTRVEKKQIRGFLGGTADKILVASDLRTPPAGTASLAIDRPTINAEPLQVLFLSRITPMKNLTFALEVLSHVNVPVHLSIVGPVRDSVYWEDCRTIIQNLRGHIQVSYRGGVPHQAVAEHYRKSHLLFLPTRGENFGHVIPEALQSGTPVLISDNTPWQDLEVAGVGWNVPLSKKSRYVDIIEEVAAMSENQRRAQRRKVLEYARSTLSDEDAVMANRRLFRRAASQSG